MAKDKVDLASQLREYRFDHDVLQEIPCSKSECKEYSKLRKQGLPLPDDVFLNEDYSPTSYYRIYQAELTENELAEYLQYKQLAMLKTIKNGMVFFVSLAIVGLVGWVLVLLNYI